MTISPLARTLDHELLALIRGASLECLVCGEFVMHFKTVGSTPANSAGAVACPECRSILADGVAVPELDLPVVAERGR